MLRKIYFTGTDYSFGILEIRPKQEIFDDFKSNNARLFKSFHLQESHRTPSAGIFKIQMVECSAKIVIFSTPFYLVKQVVQWRFSSFKTFFSGTSERHTERLLLTQRFFFAWARV